MVSPTPRGIPLRSMRKAQAIYMFRASSRRQLVYYALYRVERHNKFFYSMRGLQEKSETINPQKAKRFRDHTTLITSNLRLKVVPSRGKRDEAL